MTSNNNASDVSSSDASGSPSSSPSSSHASPSIGSSSSTKTDTTDASTTVPPLDLNLKTLLLELFGFKATTSSTNNTTAAPAPCLDPAIWAAWQRTASLSTIATTQLLNTMRMGAPYTPERFVETYALLAGVFRQTYDDCEKPERVERGKGKGRMQ